MDIASEAKRRAEAIDRITVSANAIGDKLELSDLSASVAGATHRVPQYKQLFQLEAVADLLEAVQRKIAPDTTPEIDATPVATELAEANSTPAAVKLAHEKGVDLRTITGTGAGGKITVNDVKAAMEQL